jgi:hypothetical protein
MIVRILNYGQYRVGDEAVEGLNDVDDRIEAAIEAGDERQFQACLTELVALVQEGGELVPATEFVSSEAIVPAPGSTLQEARSLLTSEGLVPDGRR